VSINEFAEEQDEMLFLHESADEMFDDMDKEQTWEARHESW
jgi:hypothetical protein